MAGMKVKEELSRSRSAMGTDQETAGGLKFP